MSTRLIPLGEAGLAALVEGDLPAASRVCGVPLGPAFLDDAWLWELRLAQVRADPVAAQWVARVAVDGDVVVGRAGFHGPPDADGVVEVGYSVEPACRGRGYGHALLRLLLDEADASPQVRTVRASVRPDNAPSLAIVRRAGFVHVGEQVDEIDGLELVFDRPSP